MYHTKRYIVCLNTSTRLIFEYYSIQKAFLKKESTKASGRCGMSDHMTLQ